VRGIADEGPVFFLEALAALWRDLAHGVEDL
jgi:hypothetical protein